MIHTDGNPTIASQHGDPLKPIPGTRVFVTDAQGKTRVEETFSSTETETEPTARPYRTADVTVTVTIHGTCLNEEAWQEIVRNALAASTFFLPEDLASIVAVKS